jgi:hypothetical protein
MSCQAKSPSTTKSKELRTVFSIREGFNMNATARFLMLAPAGAMLLLAGALAVPAGAQGEACKSEIITATGRAKFRPFSKAKELEGHGAAMADAITAWQQNVDAKFGDQWKSWSKAKDTTFTCAPTKSGRIIGSSFIGCTISGRPCVSGTPTRGETAVNDHGRDEDKGVRGRESLKAEIRERENTRRRYRETERDDERDGERESREWIPPRPHCGKYRYWNGAFCVDARYNPAYVGPR